MSTRRDKPARSTALVRQPPAQLAPAPVLAGEIVERPGTPPDPLTTYLKTMASPHSRRVMRSRLGVAAAVLSPGATPETFDWGRLSFAAIVKVKSTLEERGRAPSTVNLTIAALKGMARTLFGLGMMSAHARTAIDDVRGSRGSREQRRPVLDSKEIRKLFKAAVRDTPDATAARDTALLAVLFGAGLRRDEASRLDVSDYRDGELIVRGKGNKERKAPIGPDAAGAVEEWLRMRGKQKTSALFLSINKKGVIGEHGMSAHAVFQRVRMLTRRASIAVASPHALRRAFVTQLLEAGEDLATVSKAAGHANITTTARYDRRNDKRVKEAVGRIVVPVARDREREASGKL